MAWLQMLVFMTALVTSRGNDTVQLLAPGYALGYASRYADNYAQRTTRPPDTHIPVQPQKDQLLASRSTSEQNKDDEVPNNHSKSHPQASEQEYAEKESPIPPYPPNVPYNIEPNFPTTAPSNAVADDYTGTHVTHQRPTNQPKEDELQHTDTTLHSYLEPPHLTTSRVSSKIVDKKEPVQNHDHDSNRGQFHDQDVTKPRPIKSSRRTAAAVDDVLNTHAVPRQRTSTPKDVQTSSRHSLRTRQNTEDPLVTSRSEGDRHIPRRERVPTTPDHTARRYSAQQRLVGRLVTTPAVQPTLPPRAPPRRDAIGRSATRRAQRVTLTLPMERPAPTRGPSRSGRTHIVNAEAMQNSEDVENRESDGMKFREVSNPTFQKQKMRLNETDFRNVRDGENASEEIVVPRESKGLYTHLINVVGEGDTSTLMLKTSTNDPGRPYGAINQPNSSGIENKQLSQNVPYRNELRSNISNVDYRIEGTPEHNTEDKIADSVEQSDAFPIYTRGRDNFPRQEPKPLHEHSYEDSHLSNKNDDRLDHRSQSTMATSSKDMKDQKNLKESHDLITDEHDSNPGQLNDHSNKNEHDNVSRYPNSEKSRTSNEKQDDPSHKKSEDNHDKPPHRPVDISPITFTYTNDRNSPQPYQYNNLLQKMNETLQSNSRNRPPNQLLDRSLDSPQNLPVNQSILGPDKNYRSEDQSHNHFDSLQRQPNAYPSTQPQNQEYYVDRFQNPQHDHSLQRSNQHSENYSPSQSEVRHNDQGDRSHDSKDESHNSQDRLIDRSQYSQNQQLDQRLPLQDRINDGRNSQTLPYNTQGHPYEESHKERATERSQQIHIPTTVNNEQSRPNDRHQEQSHDDQQYRVKEDRNDHPDDSQVHQDYGNPQERLAVIPYSIHKPIHEYSINYANRQTSERANDKSLGFPNVKMPRHEKTNDRPYEHSEQAQEKSYEQEVQNENVSNEPFPNSPPTRPPQRHTSTGVLSRRNSRRRDRDRPSDPNQDSQDNAASNAPDDARACLGRRGRLVRGCANRNNRDETQLDPQQSKTRRRDAYGNQRASVSRQRQEWGESLDDSNEALGRTPDNRRGPGVAHRLQPGSLDDNSLLQAEEEAWALNEWGGESWDWGAASASGFFDYLPAWESFRTSPRTRLAAANALVPEEDYEEPPPPPSPAPVDANGWRRRSRPTRLPPQTSSALPPPEGDVQTARNHGGRSRNRGLHERKPHKYRGSVPDVSEEQENGGNNKETAKADEALEVQSIEQKSGFLSKPGELKSGRPSEENDRLNPKVDPAINKNPDSEDVQEVSSRDLPAPPQQRDEKEILGSEKHKLGYLFPLSERLEKQNSHSPFDIYIPRVKLNFDSYPIHGSSTYTPKYLQEFSLSKEKNNGTRETGESNESKDKSQASLSGDGPALEREREREEKRERNYEWGRERDQELDRERDHKTNLERERQRNREEEKDIRVDRERDQDGVRVSKEKALPVTKAGGKCGGKECDGDDRTDRFYGNDEQTAASRWRLISKHRPVLDIHGWNPFADWD